MEGKAGLGMRRTVRDLGLRDVDTLPCLGPTQCNTQPAFSVAELRFVRSYE